MLKQIISPVDKNSIFLSTADDKVTWNELDERLDEKVAKLNLGNEFHSKRLKLISSQVSNIPLHVQKKHNYKSRLKLAINALNDNKLMVLINSTSKFENLEKDYISILNDKNIIIHAIKY